MWSRPALSRSIFECYELLAVMVPLCPRIGHRLAGLRRLEKQRLPGLSLGQHARYHQRRRQGDFAVRGCGQTQGVRPQNQRLHQLPRRCHRQTSRRTCPAQPVNCAICHERQTESYNASVHGLALKAGHLDAATCQDCHDSHEIVPANLPASPLNYAHLAETCGACHDQEVRDVSRLRPGRRARWRR